MLRLSFFILLISIFCYSQQRDTPSYLKGYYAADSLFHAAEKLVFEDAYDEDIESNMNADALRLFQQLIPSIEKDKNDSLAYYCHLKMGILYHYFDSLLLARDQYQLAITKKEKKYPDSLLFKPLLFKGSIFYSINEFDSAFQLYKQAEAIADQYTSPLEEEQRLFNRLGVMYYETGNYKQAKNYFEKALSLLSPSDPNYEPFKVNYQINIASTLLKNEEFKAAASIYQSLLPFGMNVNEINQNLGSIYLTTGEPLQAINYFKKVNYTNKSQVLLLNKTGKAFLQLGLTDSANYYFQQALIENKKWYKSAKNIAAGITYTYQAELLLTQHKKEAAASLFQESIIQFHDTFNETDIYKNPESFTGIYSFVNLFNALTGKANVLADLFEETKEVRYLKGSLNAFQSAFSLSSFIEKTYSSDEARLFLGRIKYSVHSRPISISLKLFETTKDIQYLNTAFELDQINKASILTLTMEENEFRKAQQSGTTLFEQEQNLKRTITRLSLKVSIENDEQLKDSLLTVIRDTEINLSKIQEKIAGMNLSTASNSSERVVTAKDLQNNLDQHSAILSYHLSSNQLVLFSITNNSFTYFSTLIDSTFFQLINDFKSTLYNSKAAQRYTGKETATLLYKILISSQLKNLNNIKRLVIIPDDELHYLPFEALQNDKKEYLIENFSIQYQFSSTLLSTKTNGNSSTLAFAPFATTGYRDSDGFTLSELPASREEFNGVKGQLLVDKDATKSRFFTLSNHYGIIHLATHASANDLFPEQSFIAFNPGDKDYKLYAGEIANLHLDAVNLIILSACETGNGALIRGEGLMSISRAFAYAGCPNIITSLWKAEDKTTSYITNRLHYYLGKNYTKDKALQQAKLDLLKDKELPPQLKSPTYWANIVFIGNYEPEVTTSKWWAIAIAIIIGAFIYFIAKRKTR